MIKRDRKFFFTFLFPSIVILFILTIVPFLYGLYVSFHDASLVKIGNFIGLQNYINTFKNPNFYSSLKVTVIFVFSAVILELFIGLLIAFLLQNAKFKSMILNTLFLIPMASTPAVIGILWRIMFETDNGIINYLLGTIGIPKVPWLGHPVAALISLIIIDVWEWSPFFFLIGHAGLLSIPEDVYEAGKIDGAGVFTQFFKISLPLITPLISLAVFLRFIDAYKMFDIVYVVTSGGPGSSTENMSMYAYRQGFIFFHVGYSSALAIIMLIIILIVDYFRRKSTQLVLR